MNWLNKYRCIKCRTFSFLSPTVKHLCMSSSTTYIVVSIPSNRMALRMLVPAVGEIAVINLSLPFDPKPPTTPPTLRFNLISQLLLTIYNGYIFTFTLTIIFAIYYAVYIHIFLKVLFYVHHLPTTLLSNFFVFFLLIHFFSSVYVFSFNHILVIFTK